MGPRQSMVIANSGWCYEPDIPRIDKDPLPRRLVEELLCACTARRIVATLVGNQLDPAVLDDELPGRRDLTAAEEARMMEYAQLLIAPRLPPA